MVDRPLVERKLGRIDGYLRELGLARVASLEDFRRFAAVVRAYLGAEAP
jgi:hypothetical protein